MNLITNLKFWLALLAAAILAALLALAWRQGGAAARAELAAVRAQHADVLRQIAEKTLAAERAVHTASQAWAGQIAALDTPMPKSKTTACALLPALALCACASQAPVQVQPPAVTCPRPAPPAAWAMQPPKLMQAFESVFSISEGK